MIMTGNINSMWAPDYLYAKYRNLYCVKFVANED